MNIFRRNEKQDYSAVQPACPAQGEAPQGKKHFVPPTMEVIPLDADALTDIVIASNINPETGLEYGNDVDDVTLP